MPAAPTHPVGNTVSTLPGGVAERVYSNKVSFVLFLFIFFDPFLHKTNGFTCSSSA